MHTVSFNRNWIFSTVSVNEPGFGDSELDGGAGPDEEEEEEDTENDGKTRYLKFMI